jgi:hypothetical protein
MKDKQLKKNNILYNNKKSTMTMRSAKMKVVNEKTADDYGSFISIMSDDTATRVRAIIGEQFQLVNDVFTIVPRYPMDYPDLELTELITALENEFKITIGEYDWLCPQIYEGGGCKLTVDNIIRLVLK